MDPIDPIEAKTQAGKLYDRGQNLSYTEILALVPEACPNRQRAAAMIRNELVALFEREAALTPK